MSRSAPCVIVVFSESALFSGSVSPAVGILAETVIVPCCVVSTSNASVAVPPLAASAGTVQVIVATPVTGTGAQPVMVPENPLTDVLAGMSMSIVETGASAGPKPLLVTDKSKVTVAPAGLGSKPVSSRLSSQSTSCACAAPAKRRKTRIPKSAFARWFAFAKMFMAALLKR